MPWESTPVQLTKTQRKTLKATLRSKSATAQEKVRARIILDCANGLKNKDIARRVGVHENTVVKWRMRWKAGTKDAQISDYGELTGRPRSILLPKTMKHIKKKAAQAPPAPHTRWTVRLMAAEVGISLATCQRALRELDITFYKDTAIDSATKTNSRTKKRTQSAKRHPQHIAVEARVPLKTLKADLRKLSTAAFVAQHKVSRSTVQRLRAKYNIAAPTPIKHRQPKHQAMREDIPLASDIDALVDEYHADGSAKKHAKRFNH